VIPISDPDEIEDLLATAPLQVEGQFLWGSNYTFLARLQVPDG